MMYANVCELWGLSRELCRDIHSAEQRAVSFWSQEDEPCMN